MMNPKSVSQFRWAGVRAAVLGLAIVSVAPWMSGCSPLVVSGAMVGGTLVALDRRTSGAQVEDEAIEFKGTLRVREIAGSGAHVNLTSYNRMVLITGEVPSADDVKKVEQAVSRLDNVRSVVNELAVAPASSLTTRSTDTVTTGRIKAAFIDTKDLQANSIKVVTERGIVYLMGRVTARESKLAAEVVRGVPGVQKVVRVFESITEEELAALRQDASDKGAKKP
jgi:osmotically-inducible protein OsmY